MILKKLTMKNFRQFIGIQEIEFASDVGNNNKNVTVIFGENGRGKTSIFRAVMFCLYGEKRLSQDEDVEQNELALINLYKLQGSEAEGKPVETFVELEFIHKGEKYNIKRNILGILVSGERHEQPDKVSLSHTKSDGNTKIVSDPEEIKNIVNTMLDKNVREYFLFDGEKIQRLTLASLEQRREIAKGIKNLLNVDALEKAIKATHRLKKNLNDELSRKAKGEYGKVINQLNDLDEKRNELRERLQQLEDEYSLAVSEKKRVDKELDKFNEIRHFLMERANCEERQEQQEEQIKNLLSEMKTKIVKVSTLLLSDTVDHVFSAIDYKKQKGEIPSEIRKDLIEKLLDEKTCICKRPLLPGEEPFKEVLRWKNKVSDVDLESSALDMWRYLSTIRSHRDDVSETVIISLQKYGNCRNEIETLRNKIEHINKEIGTQEREDAAKLEKHRENIEEKLVKIAAQRNMTNDEIQIIENEYERLLGERKILEQEESIKNELSLRANIAEEAYNTLRSVYDEFTKEIKHKISDEASKYFSQLLDKEGCETLKHIIVNDDYSLQVLDKWGKPFLANISAGQRQIMSISFIAALAKVAAAETILEMPLFMDTPFGRLSYEHRKNLLEKLPDYCAQWILLATGTEFRRQESLLLQQGRRWGKFYVLHGEGAGITKLQERDILDAQSLLSENEEEGL